MVLSNITSVTLELNYYRQGRRNFVSFHVNVISITSDDSKGNVVFVFAMVLMVKEMLMSLLLLMTMMKELLFVITIIFAITLKGLLLVAIALKDLLLVATMFVALRELMLVA